MLLLQHQGGVVLQAWSWLEVVGDHDVGHSPLFTKAPPKNNSSPQVARVYRGKQIF